MDDILSIAETWSFWDRPVPESVPRDVDLPPALRDSLALVVVGVRRSGKSTLMRQMIARYKLNPNHCVFLNFEDPRLAGALDYPTLEALVESFRKRHRRVRKLYFFLDEVQWVSGWERWLRSQLDRPSGNHFILSGSNGQLLGGSELATSLTGRHWTCEVFPFSLPEAKRLVPAMTVERFLEDGGFPEPMQIPEGDRLRRQYFEDIVERDIRERIGARSALPIRQVVQMVFESAGSELSLRRLAAATGLAVETVGGYLDACEAAHLLFSCPFFAYSERKRASMNRKYYPVDPGLRRIAVSPTGRDRGKALECATYVALRRKYGQIYYWRGRGEVDFVFTRDGVVVPCQVTWEGPTARHERALTDFYEAFPQAAECLFVTRDDFESFAEELR
ncbi:MAG TPA: ATP-binding protein [Pseudomonadales bacterium]